MSCIIKVFLLLAVVFCVSKANRTESGQQCLCQNPRNGLQRSQIRDIQIYPATIFCDRVEIVVTTSKGRFCLNPNNNAVKLFLKSLLKNKKTSVTTRPAYSTSNPDSSKTARF